MPAEFRADWAWSPAWWTNGCGRARESIPTVSNGHVTGRGPEPIGLNGLTTQAEHRYFSTGNVCPGVRTGVPLDARSRRTHPDCTPTAVVSHQRTGAPNHPWSVDHPLPSRRADRLRSTRRQPRSLAGVRRQGGHHARRACTRCDQTSRSVAANPADGTQYQMSVTRWSDETAAASSGNSATTRYVP